MSRNIILGINNTVQFDRAIKLYDCSSYPFPDILNHSFFMEAESILSLVSLALSRCDKCYFVLDDIKIPLNPQVSFTCEELRFVLNNPFLMDKITFLLDNEVIDEQFVIDKYRI